MNCLKAMSNKYVTILPFKSNDPNSEHSHACLALMAAITYVSLSNLTSSFIQ